MSKYKYWVRHNGIDYAPGKEVPDENKMVTPKDDKLPFGEVPETEKETEIKEEPEPEKEPIEAANHKKSK